MVLAQYGQWDGDQVGLRLLKWLQTPENINMLNAKLRDGTLFVPSKAELKLYQEFIDREKEDMSEWTSKHGKIFFEEAIDRVVPSLSRNTSNKILDLIVQSSKPVPIILADADFVFDSACEWAYVLDMDEKVFETYNGLIRSSEPVSTSRRFDFLTTELGEQDRKYYPWMLRAYDFSALPSEEAYRDDIYKASGAREWSI